MDNPLISVIVPVYNAEKYLRSCIESILKQTYRGIELILVDDGSKDNSLAICNEYTMNPDISVRVIHQTNSGSSIARKTGIVAAHGKYIGFVDADDYIAENMYESMLARAEDHNADIVMCGITYLSGNGAVPLQSRIPSGEYKGERLEELKATAGMDGIKPAESVISPSLCNKIIRYEIIVKHMQDIDERLSMGDDWAVSYPCLWDAKSLVVMDECFYYYCYNNEGITKSYNEHMWRDIGQLFSVSMRIKERYRYPYDAYYRAYFQYMIILCLVNETYYTGGSRFWQLRNRLNRALSGKVCQYALEGGRGRYASRRSKVLIFLAKHRAFSTLAVLLDLIRRRSEGI